MCGIVGYIGKERSQPILLQCLERLEYRGYDSCGIAILNSTIKVYKDKVRVGVLSKALPRIDGEIGIGHTRWATHGEPSQANAHPHLDCKGQIAVVHNGIITNYDSLRQQLVGEGHHFVSETDTEVLPHLIEKYYAGNLEEAVEKALRQVSGSYAILVIKVGEAKIVAAKRDSPLIIGIGDRGYFAASDVPAILDYTDKVMYLEDGDIALITPDGVKVRRDGKEILRPVQKVLWSVADAEKSGYEHFMLKEIHEQPRVIRDTLSEYMLRAQIMPDLKSLSGSGGGVVMLASGTSYHAALVGKHVIEQLTGIPVRAEVACEFNYGRTPSEKVAIGITQSGETADTLKAMRKFKETGGHLVAITNTVGSGASRIADEVFYTRAGPEISVAATKTFIAQLVALYCIALDNAKISKDKMNYFLDGLRQMPDRIARVFDNEEQIQEYAEYIAGFENVFFIARGTNLPVAMEGALKLKEISYIHAESYSAGELKHGAFALLGLKTPVVAIVARDNTYEAMLSNLREIKARKSPVIALMEEGDTATEELADYVIPVPQVEPIFSPFINTVVVQLIAYYAARHRGCPIDFPRNLAKSVTVE